ncbi:sodium:solute symporter family protein [Chrysiogenes arsenatis]|uniref:sodium:solute symporter family protein n=1 Tax=Chrysiogenes arsenatis TaxID=309797 RepID=UPI0004293241|nr:sodium:solute symporter family protein [Chrysiogenes arsenatis]
MDLQTLIYLFVGGSFALYIGIAVWAKAGSTKDFYVAGGGVPPFMNGMATAADWMSAASFISMAGLIAFLGYDGSMYLMGWTGGYVLLAMLLAPYLRKFGKFTVPDFVGDRYYSDTARVVAAICTVFISFTYVAGQMRGVGIVFSRFLQVDVNTGVIIGMLIVFFYAVLGGMKGITYTQVAQYCVLITAYLVPAIFLSIMTTGHFLPQTGMGATVIDPVTGQDTGVYLLDRLDGILTDLGFKAYTEGTKSTLDLFFITVALMAGTAGLPHVIVRFFTVPRVADARTSAGYALFFIALLYTTAPAVGVFARSNIIATVHNVDYAEAPAWFKTWEKTGLIKVTNMQPNADGKVILDMSRGAKENAVSVDRDIMVLATPEMAGLPNWVIALVAAGGMAAALSTAAGLLLVISTSFAHDILGKVVMKGKMTEKSELLAARIAAAFAVCVAGLFGIYPPGFVAQVVAFAFGLAAASFFPVIIMGVFSKRMNKEGAIAGMVVGLSFTFTYIVYCRFVNTDPSIWWFGISPEGIGTLGMLFNFVASYVVSSMTAPPPQHIQDLIEDVRIPKGAGAATHH